MIEKIKEDFPTRSNTTSWKHIYKYDDNGNEISRKMFRDTMLVFESVSNNKYKGTSKNES